MLPTEQQSEVRHQEICYATREITSRVTSPKADITSTCAEEYEGQYAQPSQFQPASVSKENPQRSSWPAFNPVGEGPCEAGLMGDERTGRPDDEESFCGCHKMSR